MGRGHGLWLCKHLIWRTLSLPSPTSLVLLALLSGCPTAVEKGETMLSCRPQEGRGHGFCLLLPAFRSC